MKGDAMKKLGRKIIMGFFIFYWDEVVTKEAVLQILVGDASYLCSIFQGLYASRWNSTLLD